MPKKAEGQDENDAAMEYQNKPAAKDKDLAEYSFQNIYEGGLDGE